MWGKEVYRIVAWKKRGELDMKEIFDSHFIFLCTLMLGFLFCPGDQGSEGILVIMQA